MIQRLVLHDFRNYRHVDLEPSPSVNVLLGRNAQGKTNLLESFLFLGLGKSPRTGRDAELVRWGSRVASALALVKKRDSNGKLQIIVPVDSPKRITWNDNPLRPRDALGILTTVSFFPDDLYLVKGGPAQRRRLLDVLLSQADKKYARHLTRFQRILRHRNVQLKALQGHGRGRELLAVLNEQLLEEAVPVVVSRARALQHLAHVAARVHGGITEGRERLELVYKPFFAGEDQQEPNPDWQDYAAVADMFREAMREMERDELRRGVSLVGPQRDDVRFLIDGADARSYASQGQQRTAVLAVKLAELDYLRSETGEHPVLLLDDVLSELDAVRRGFLLETVAEQVQTFITTANPEPLSERLMRSARVFRVHEGTVAPA